MSIISPFSENIFPQVQGTFPTDKTQLIWLCAPPVSVEVWGGLMVEGMEFQRRSMRYDTIITVIVLIFLLKVQRDGGELDGCAHHRRPWLRRVGPALLDDPPGF